MIGRIQTPASAAAVTLATLPAAILRVLPASVREFYGEPDARALLREHSNDDRPLELGQSLSDRWPGYDPLGNGYLPLMVENQGVCTWAVRLGAEPDPPVLVEVDSGNPPQWQLLTPTFSAWIRCVFFDGLTMRNAAFAAQDEALRSQDLSALRGLFREADRSDGWPASTQYRFESELGRILLWNAPSLCDWWIAPATPDLAAELLTLLGELGQLRETLYDVDGKFAEALTKFRRR